VEKKKKSRPQLGRERGWFIEDYRHDLKKKKMTTAVFILPKKEKES